VWLAAAALALAVVDGTPKIRLPVQTVAIALLAFGVLLRPNALLAAPILATVVLWPARFSWKRAALGFIPAAIVCFVLVQVVYYGVLGAKREHALHSIMVFDLGGITHFTKQNQFPGSWTLEETTMLTERCYEPTVWDIYWTREPCLFVMQRLEATKIFGSPQMPAAWRRAVMSHPLAYLQHRAAFMWQFLAGTNLTIWTQDLDDTSKLAYADKPKLMAVKAVDDALLPTPLLRAGTWLLLCVVVALAGWRRRDTPAGAFAIGVGGSAVVYLLTFAAVGVASDFRYAYWAVLAGLAGAAVIWPTTWGGRRHSPAAHPPS
jgi:hypothetical protein